MSGADELSGISGIDPHAALHLAVQHRAPVDATETEARALPQALLVHGLASRAEGGVLLERTLVAQGWQVTAIDLRGHGRSPRSTAYGIADYAADIAALPAPEGGWDLVIGHSLGGAVSAVVAADDPAWTARLVLVDPALHVTDRGRERLLASLHSDLAHPEAGFQHAKQPLWNAEDVQIKLTALVAVDPHAIDGTVAQNDPWDVRAEAARLAVPTLLIGADPASNALLSPADAVALTQANRQLVYRIVPGAGHNVHRDAPVATAALLRSWLSGSWPSLKRGRPRG